MDDPALCRSIEENTDVIATAFDGSNEQPVPHCFGWTVGDLVAHHGGVLRWAEATVRTNTPAHASTPAPTAHADRLAWYREAVERFVTTAKRADRDEACWTFGRPPERVWFWTRRQALEAAIHRWDAEAAIGSSSPIESELAAVGIVEVVEDLFPRQIDLDRTLALSGGIELSASDAGRSWRLQPETAAGAVISGPASSLLLLLWGRVALDDATLQTEGSESLLAELGAASITP